MNWPAVRARFQLIDHTGLQKDQITTLRLMIAAVAFGIVWTNVTTGVAMTGFMKELGASDFLYGLVIALPNIANAFQFLCSYILERGLKPRRMMLISGFIQRLIWIPFALIPFFIPATHAALRVWSAVVMALVSASMAPFMNVAFYTIASDAVPMRMRGRYFATRTRVSTLVGLLIGLLIGFLLDALPGYTGYAVVFVLAGLFGAFDIACYLFMRVPPMTKPAKQNGILQMMRCVLRDKDYMRVVLAITAWLFTVQCSSPYFNVYLRSALGVSNLNVILTGQVASNLFLIFFVSRWGRAIDTYGNRPVYLVAAFLASITPLWWIRVAGSMLLLIGFANAWSGGVYCAVDLTMQNLFMNEAKAENRSMYFAVYFLFTQLFGLALGSTAGGLLLDDVLYRVDEWRLLIAGVPFTRYNALFVLSAVLRFLVVFLLLPRIREEGAQPVSALLAGGRAGLVMRIQRMRALILRKRLHARARRQASSNKGDRH